MSNLPELEPWQPSSLAFVLEHRLELEQFAMDRAVRRLSYLLEQRLELRHR